MNAILSKRIGVLYAAVLFAVAGCNSSSSSKSTAGAGLGTFAGLVTDARKSPVAGAVITPVPGNGARPVMTDADGTYSLSVPAGTYTLSFTADNMQTATSDSASVAFGETTRVDMQLQSSPLQVVVNLPAALVNGGPAGFDTTVSGITATVTMNGSPIAADGVTWEIINTDGFSPPPTAAIPSPATGAGTSFAVPAFEDVRQGANTWLNTRYSTTAEPFDYVQAPERDQLLSFGPQQVAAMSYLVKATATSGGLTSTGSATVSPLTISSGGNLHPVGMMIVGNAPSTATYSWALTYLKTDAAKGDTFGAPPAGVTLQGSTTKNPTLVPTVDGVYQLTNGTDAPLSFRVSRYHGMGTGEDSPGNDGVTCASCHNGTHALEQFAAWQKSAHGNTNWQNPAAPPMQLVQAGLSGLIDGGFYAEFCMQCHTTGYSKVPSALSKASDPKPAGSRGFADVAANPEAPDTAWTFPAKLGPDAWTSVVMDSTPSRDSGVLHRAGIQCESCHGPLEPTDHSMVAAIGYSLVSPVASMSAGICLQCHDEFPYHDKGPLWSASPHASMDLALGESTVEGRGTGVEHCGRCHSGEGFVAYAAQINAGQGGASYPLGYWGILQRPSSVTALDGTTPTCTPSKAFPSNADPSCPCASTTDYVEAGLAKPASGTCYNDTAYYTYFQGKNLTQASVHSQTCQTCHDPHSTELRFDGDAPINAAGWSFPNAGAGALCMTCHNERSAVVYSDSDIYNWASPHTPSQGDIFAGRSAYFFGMAKPATWPAVNTDPGTKAYIDATVALIPTVAASLPDQAFHASILGDTCVDCHVKFVPPDLAAQFGPAGTNHTFKTTRAVCAGCHGPDMADRMAGPVDDKTTQVLNLVSAKFKDRLNLGVDAMAAFQVVGGVLQDDTTKFPTINVTVAAGSVAGVQLSTSHGSPALIVTLNDGTAFAATVSTSSPTTPVFKAGGNQVFVGAAGKAPLTDNQKIVAKAYWNYQLIVGGSAHGLHNLEFANGVLDATITALEGGGAL
jgi:hypothetical protein